MSAGFALVNNAIPVYKLVAAFDVDPISNATYKKNLDLKPFQADISKYAERPHTLLRQLYASGWSDSRPTVLIGCAPCQGFSSHRNAAGNKDDRNSLFLDFIYLATKLRPTAVVIENVPELLTHRYWPYVSKLRNALEGAGYFTHLAVHNMAAFGVAQERFRVVAVAMRRPFRPLAGYLARTGYKSVRSSIGELPEVRPGAVDPSDPLHYSAEHRASTLRIIAAVPKNGGNRPADLGPESLRRIARRQGKAAYEDVYGRLSWDKPAITITAYARNPASGRFIHPEQDRGLTVREAALLQGFPRDYWFEGSFDKRFSQIGNAVPPTFSAFVASYLIGEMVSDPPTRHHFDAGIRTAVGSSYSRLIPSIKAGYR
jgi:DNA (cytosine-5)-methyltransferase 1